MTNRAILLPVDVAEPMAVRGTVVKSKWAHSLLTFLAVFGPGLIVMVADNDAGGISTYAQTGAKTGFNLLESAAGKHELVAAQHVIGIQRFTGRHRHVRDVARSQFQVLIRLL